MFNQILLKKSKAFQAMPVVSRQRPRIGGLRPDHVNQHSTTKTLHNRCRALLDRAQSQPEKIRCDRGNRRWECAPPVRARGPQAAGVGRLQPRARDACHQLWRLQPLQAKELQVQLQEADHKRGHYWHVQFEGERVKVVLEKGGFWL